MSKLPFEDFKCDNCGACCRSLIVEAHYYDAMREPKLYQLDPEIDREKLREGDRCLVLHDRERRCCPFLEDSSNLCTIYETRPVACVLVEPGDAKCQQARKMKGLPMLRDSRGSKPELPVLVESCEFYDLDLEDILE